MRIATPLLLILSLTSCMPTYIYQKSDWAEITEEQAKAECAVETVKFNISEPLCMKGKGFEKVGVE